MVSRYKEFVSGNNYNYLPTMIDEHTEIYKI